MQIAESFIKIRQQFTSLQKFAVVIPRGSLNSNSLKQILGSIEMAEGGGVREGSVIAYPIMITQNMFALSASIVIIVLFIILHKSFPMLYI